VMLVLRVEVLEAQYLLGSRANNIFFCFRTSPLFPCRYQRQREAGNQQQERPWAHRPYTAPGVAVVAVQPSQVEQSRVSEFPSPSAPSVVASQLLV